MKPPPLRYERADSVDGATQFLAAEGDNAKVLAGGQSLVALLNLRLARPDVLLDIGDLAELRGYGPNGTSFNVGALATQRTLERDGAVRDACPLLAEAIPHIGHVAIRNRGTLGGSIAHADASAEAPVVLAALGGSVVLRSASGERTVPAEEFFLGFLMTAARPDELLTEVRFSKTEPDTGYAFVEFARRPGDFALVCIGCTIRVASDGSAGPARFAVGGVGGTPVVIQTDALSGALPGDAAATAADLVDQAIDPAADIHGTVEYRRHLARHLVKRAVTAALDSRGASS